MRGGKSRGAAPLTCLCARTVQLFDIRPTRTGNGSGGGVCPTAIVSCHCEDTCVFVVPNAGLGFGYCCSVFRLRLILDNVTSSGDISHNVMLLSPVYLLVRTRETTAAPESALVDSLSISPQGNRRRFNDRLSSVQHTGSLGPLPMPSAFCSAPARSTRHRNHCPEELTQCSLEERVYAMHATLPF